MQADWRPAVVPSTGRTRPAALGTSRTSLYRRAPVDLRYSDTDEAFRRELRTCLADALQSQSLTIAAGSSQIQRNIISERILELPKERRAEAPVGELRSGREGNLAESG